MVQLLTAISRARCRQFPSIRDSSPDLVESNIVSNNIDEESNDLLSDTANPNEDAPILLLPASTTTSRFQKPQTDDSMREDDDDERENQSSAAASETTLRLVRRRYGSGLANLGNTWYEQTNELTLSSHTVAQLACSRSSRLTYSLLLLFSAFPASLSVT